MIEVLRRPVESALATGVGVVDQPAQVADAVTVAGPDRVLETVHHKFGVHACRCAPTDDAPGEHVEHERDIDRSGPGCDIGEVGDPEPVRCWCGEVSFDQVSRAQRARIAGRGAHSPAASCATPALSAHEALDSAPGHLVTAGPQIQPHLAGTEPGPKPMLACLADQLKDPRVPQRASGRRPAAGLVVGGRSDRDRVLGEHPADRLDSVKVAMLIDELDQYRCGRSSSAAKKADALLRIWFARSSSETFFFRSRISASSSVVLPGRVP